MKIKPLIISLGSIALVAIFCTSAFLSYAETHSDNSVIEGNVCDCENFSEMAYINKDNVFAENLPYYETEETDEKVVVESVTINKNGNFYLLDSN